MLLLSIFPSSASSSFSVVGSVGGDSIAGIIICGDSTTTSSPTDFGDVVVVAVSNTFFIDNVRFCVVGVIKDAKDFGCFRCCCFVGERSRSLPPSLASSLHVKEDEDADADDLLFFDDNDNRDDDDDDVLADREDTSRQVVLTLLLIACRRLPPVVFNDRSLRLLVLQLAKKEEAKPLLLLLLLLLPLQCDDDGEFVGTNKPRRDPLRLLFVVGVEKVDDGLLLLLEFWIVLILLLLLLLKKRSTGCGVCILLLLLFL